MKKVAILTNYLREYKKNDFYFQSEKLLRDVLSEHGIEMVYVTHYCFDQTKNHFSEYVTVGEDEMITIKKIYTPDLLRLKTPWSLQYQVDLFSTANFIVTPTFRLKKIESDKFQMYRYLHRFQPYTTLLTSYYFYDWIRETFEGELVVVKPITGSGGYGVNFYCKDEIYSPEVCHKYEWMEALNIVQQFKNFGHWIPGIVQWNHDLRIVFLGDMPSFSVIRSPKEGSLKSNVASGWKQFSIKLSDIPPKVMKMCQDIQSVLNTAPNDSYSFDFGYCYDEKKRYLIEINSAPGIRFPAHDLPYQYKFFHDLGTYFSTLLISYGHEDHEILDIKHYIHLLPEEDRWLYERRSQTQSKSKKQIGGKGKTKK